MEITIPEEIFGIKKWEATVVVRNYNVATFIKGIYCRNPRRYGLQSRRIYSN